MEQNLIDLGLTARQAQAVARLAGAARAAQLKRLEAGSECGLGATGIDDVQDLDDSKHADEWRRAVADQVEINTVLELVKALLRVSAR